MKKTHVILLVKDYVTFLVKRSHHTYCKRLCHTSHIETDDLCADLDELANDNQNGDEMFDILNKGPEWMETFLPVHVNEFKPPTGPKLPAHFNTDTTSPLEYFQLFFTDEVIVTIVLITN